jgi:hypothetical protein
MICLAFGHSRISLLTRQFTYYFHFDLFPCTFTPLPIATPFYYLYVSMSPHICTIIPYFNHSWLLHRLMFICY